MESRQIISLRTERSTESADSFGKKRFTRRCVLGTIAGGLLAANGGIFLFRWVRGHKGTTLVINGPFSVGGYDPEEVGLVVPKAISFFSPDLIKFEANADNCVQLVFGLSYAGSPNSGNYTRLDIESKVYGAGKQVLVSTRQGYSFPKKASQSVKFSMGTVSVIPTFDHTVYLPSRARMSEISRVEWTIIPSER
jgi:hypothetical protein